MKVVVRYPVVFDGEVARHRNTKTIIGFASAEVDIPKIAPEDAPIVITVDDVDNTFGTLSGTEYRIHAGRLLVDTGWTPAAFDSEEGLEGKNRLTLPLLDAIRFKYATGDGLHVYPPKALKVIVGLMWNGGVAKELLDTHRLMLEAGKLFAHEDDVARWKEMLIRFAASFAVIEGTVWREAAEPCYTIDADRPPGLTTREASFYAKIRNGMLEGPDWTKLRIAGRNFSCLDRDRAYRYARRIAEARGFDDEINFPRIDVISPNVPTIDFEAHEFERVARLLVYDVADAFRKIAHGKGVDFFYAVPGDMMNAFIEARDCLPGMNAALGISLNQEQKIQALVDHLNEATDQGLHYLVEMNMAEINDIFEDWLSRDVSVDSIVSMTLGGGPK